MRCEMTGGRTKLIAMVTQRGQKVYPIPLRKQMLFSFSLEQLLQLSVSHNLEE
jgi:hypothetical protein